jgi:murein DD-endopeptidase MepM/ murein hydrolase activator NlpD
MHLAYLVNIVTNLVSSCMRLSYKKIPVIFGIVVTLIIVIVQPLVLAGLQSFEVSDIAKKITVSIEGFNLGSGVIIGKKDDVYQIITAWHVVERKGKYLVRTHDNRTHVVNGNTIQRMPKVDVAIVEFTSKQTYPVANIGNSGRLKEGMTVFFAGYPKPGSLNLGRNYTFFKAQITTLLKSAQNGYSLGYDNFAIDGMSGGPVLNENGELVGIHGATEIRMLTGVSGNYGIASETFRNWQQDVALASQKSIPSDPEALATLPPVFLPPNTTISSTISVKFIWPAKGILVSGYGWRWGRMHKGIDIANSTGTQIYAAADGVVEKAGWNNGGYGNLVDIRHLDGILTRYAHNSKILVQPGQKVRQGEVIALMGSTGFATGPKLHFEIHEPIQKPGVDIQDGSVNPIAFLPML